MANSTDEVQINPFDLIVTYRQNIYTSNDWQYITLKEYLNIIKNDQRLKEIFDEMYNQFIKVEGLPTESDPGGDEYIIFPKHFDEPCKTQYRSLKKELPCVNFFGKFLPPVSDMFLNCNGNGIVVLDIDLKEAGREHGILEPQLDLAENQLFDHFKAHGSLIFYYQTSSSLGYHVGYITDARNPHQYKMVFDQLVAELLEDCPAFRKHNIVDNSVGRYNANFFTNHSNLIFSNYPKKIYTGNYLDLVVEAAPIIPTEGFDEFPYSQDFRLFLAYSRMEDGEYFHTRLDWLKMIYALRSEFPYCYSSRMEHWFNKLSSLSDKFQPVKDLDDFKRFIDDYNGEKRIGVDFIINHLNGVTTQTPDYTIDDVKNYFEELDDNDLPEIETSDFFYINQYLIEIRNSLNLEGNLIIESPPNTGKSTLFLKNVHFKRIYLVPTKILIDDLIKHNPKAQVVQEGVLSVDINVTAKVIISTYEGLDKILNSKLNPADYTLIIDEAHNLFISASPNFRFLALYKICQNFKRFKNTILLSGTWINFPFTKEEFKLIKVRLRNPAINQLEIVTTETPLDTLSSDIITHPGKQIVLINNKDENNELKQFLIKNDPNSKVTLMNSDTKKSKQVKKILENNHLGPGEVLVGTQMIVEGISFLDDDINAIRFYRNMLPEYIAQLSFRARKSDVKPVIKFYQSRENFSLRKDANYANTYKKMEETSQLKDLSSMASGYIGKTAIRIYSERKIVNNKVADETLPYLFDHTVPNSPQVNLLLLGNFTLDRVSKALNADIFSHLAHLRKWNFQFTFSEGEKSSVRKDFKKTRSEDRRMFLRDNFGEIAKYTFDDLSFDKKSPVYIAWLMTQFLNIDYFLEMDSDKREKLFFDKKLYQFFADEVMGSVTLEGKNLAYVRDLLSKNFEFEDQPILSKIKSVRGYPARISNEDLAHSFNDLNLSISKLKKVLKKQFIVSEAKPSKDKAMKSSRFFSVVEIEHAFVKYVKHDAFEDPLNDAFNKF